MLTNALGGRPLPLCGESKHERHWPFVEGYCCATALVLEEARPGEDDNLSRGMPQPILKIVRPVHSQVGNQKR